ncbi:MAG: hypothetical protein PHO35_01655 [Candidatus Cloacimonetes bacterium]|jgi:hypothetical protein|nr:hypothetical protein [Candidatus Cloacimonadota bacterium]MDD4805477.1 hypothetical protein [Candidatus Cloacimonadota bacterium]
MSKKSLVILLFISLSFNLAVLGSLFWLRLARPHRPDTRELRIRYPRLPEHIERSERDPQITAARREFHRTTMALLQELRKDTVNEENIMAIIDSSLVAQTALERRLGTSLLNLRKQMSATEADEYFGKRIEFLNQRHNHIHHRRNRREKNNND